MPMTKPNKKPTLPQFICICHADESARTCCHLAPRVMIGAVSPARHPGVNQWHLRHGRCFEKKKSPMLRSDGLFVPTGSCLGVIVIDPLPSFAILCYLLNLNLSDWKPTAFPSLVTSGIIGFRNAMSFWLVTTSFLSSWCFLFSLIPLQ